MYNIVQLYSKLYFCLLIYLCSPDRGHHEKEATMTRIDLTGKISPQKLIELLEEVGLVLVEHETQDRENGLNFKQTDELWVLSASTRTVQLRRHFVRAGFPPEIPVEIREDDLWATVLIVVPQDDNEC